VYATRNVMWDRRDTSERGIEGGYHRPAAAGGVVVDGVQLGEGVEEGGPRGLDHPPLRPVRRRRQPAGPRRDIFGAENRMVLSPLLTSSNFIT